jgi:hypothetical protein
LPKKKKRKKKKEKRKKKKKENEAEDERGVVGVRRGAGQGIERAEHLDGALCGA